MNGAPDCDANKVQKVYITSSQNVQICDISKSKILINFNQTKNN